MVILNSIQSVLTILSMIALGYILTQKGWFDDKISNLFSKLITTISLPALMISNLMTTFDKKTLTQLGSGVLIPYAIILISFAVGFLIYKPLGISKKQRGVFTTLLAFSNTIFIGLPVNQSLFGDKAVPYVLLYYIANTSLFWTIGVYEIRSDANRTKGIESKDGSSRFTFDAVKKVFSPALGGFALGIILILLGIKLPRFVMDTCKYIGGLTTPISMLFTGIVIHSIDLKKIKFDLKMFVLFLGRFVISPLLALAVVYYLPFGDTMMKQVFVIQTALPVMTQISIVAKAYGADHEYAAMMVTLTTLASLVIIPLYMYIITLVW